MCARLESTLQEDGTNLFDTELKRLDYRYDVIHGHHGLEYETDRMNERNIEKWKTRLEKRRRGRKEKKRRREAENTSF
jgi:hypothetical protein